MGALVEALVERAMQLRDECNALLSLFDTSDVVAHATNPLDYAWVLHEQYLRKWGGRGATTLMLGMNPGPYGMAQSGVPFGATHCVRDFLQIEHVDLVTPKNAHPKRPIQGLMLERQEVSGTRIWSLFEEMYHTPEACFAEIFVLNHCPLLLLGQRGQNITPEVLSKSLIEPLMQACDAHLSDVVDLLQIERIIGIGKYAERRALHVMNAKHGCGKRKDGTPVRIQTVWHPSPASPRANRNNGEDWKQNVSEILHDKSA